MADTFGVSKTTVNQVRKTYAEHGIEAVFTRKTRLTPPVASKITGDLEAPVLAYPVQPNQKSPFTGYGTAASENQQVFPVRYDNVKLCLIFLWN